MQIAQKLYEGLPLADGVSEGLISYMRTDSTRLSDVFVKDAESYIEEVYGKEYKGRARQKIMKMHRMRMRLFVLPVFSIHRKK